MNVSSCEWYQVVEVLLPISALAAAVWAIILVRWVSIVTFGIVVLFAGTLFGPDFYHYAGPFQISSERILWGLLLGLFVIHWRLGKTDWKPLSRLDWLLIAFTVATGISSQFGLPITDGSNPLARWLFYIAMPTGLYFVIKNATLRTQDLALLCNFLVVIGIYLAFTAICEARGFHGIVFPKYIVNPKHWEFFGRGRGPLLNPSGTGILMTAALGCTLMRWFDTDRLGKLVYSAITLLLLAGCYSTYTRCVWLGAFATVFLILFLHSSKRLRIWALSAGVIAVLGLGGIAVQAMLEFKRDKNLSAEASKDSVELRPLLAVVAFEMFKDRPLTGHGFGHYMEAHRKYVERRNWELPLQNAFKYHQHNIFLAILVDCGAAVMSVYVLLLAGWGITSFRLYRQFHGIREVRIIAMGTLSMLIGFVSNGMFQDVTIIPMVNMYMWFFGAVCVGLYSRGPAEIPAEIPAGIAAGQPQVVSVPAYPWTWQPAAVR